MDLRGARVPLGDCCATDLLEKSQLSCNVITSWQAFLSFLPFSVRVATGESFLGYMRNCIYWVAIYGQS